MRSRSVCRRCCGWPRAGPWSPWPGTTTHRSFFEALAPLLRPLGVHLIGNVKRPDEGGILGPDELGGLPAVVAGFPFLREGKVVDFMKDAGEWYRGYADRVAAITGRYNEALVERAGADLVPILVAHFLVNGVTMGREAPARGT